MITLPRIGRRESFTAHGAAIVVTRLPSGTYHARPSPPVTSGNTPSWSRFGDADEIRADIEHFMRCGCLPFAGAGTS